MNEFNQVRKMMIDGKPWFIGKDVCRLFGDSNHNRTISRLNPEGMRTVDIINPVGRKRKTMAVN